MPEFQPAPPTSSPQPAPPVPAATQPLDLTKRPSSKKLLFLIPFSLILLVVVALLARSFLTKGSSNNGGEAVTLTYWGLWEPENVMQEIIGDFESAHPDIQISYVRQSHKDYRERLQNSLASGEGPDIFRFHNTWIPMLQNHFAAVPEKVMSIDEFERTFYPVMQKDLKLGKSYIGLPLMIDTLLLFYNEDILAAAGKTPPKAWDELFTLATELKSGGFLPVALGNSTNVDHWQDILALLLLQNGTDMKKVGSTIGSDGKNLGAEALTFYSLFDKSYDLWNETYPNSTQAFASGKLALYFGPSWEAFEFYKNPSLKFKTVPTPKLADVELYYANYWVDGVSEKSPHKEAAWEFLKFLVKKENLQKIYEAQAKTRQFGEPPSRIDMADQFRNTPIVSDVLASANKADSWYLISSAWDGASGINTRIAKYFSDAVNAVNEGGNSEESLKTVEQGISQILSQYGI
jgi:multiple sugar transport system substrate-binding protein